MMKNAPLSCTLFWFRQDLRITDNPGLFAAAQKGPVLPLYILDKNSEMGSASRWWLYHSLKALNQSLDNHLNVFQGIPEEIFLFLIKKYDVQAIYWNRRYEPQTLQEDRYLKTLFEHHNIACKSFSGSLLWEPFTVLKPDNTPYKVFTPFYRKCFSLAPRELVRAPASPKWIKEMHQTVPIDTLKLLSSPPWYDKLTSHWQIGEKAAHNRLRDFCAHFLAGYEDNRNFPFKKSVSRLSPHLHFGEISPHQVWYRLQHKRERFIKDTDAFLREIAWREFSYYLLYHFPTFPSEPFQHKFNRFPWKKNKKGLMAWQKGQTGYPLVDAGMRELWQTGYMHNRVRMIVGSFLVKNLGLDWHAGRDWFWDCLVDADLANNSINWQWVAGSGIDPAPYFRIFNPITQGEKFDPDGTYTRHFVPELKHLPASFLFKPWEAPSGILETAGVVLGKDYPFPIVDLAQSRALALTAYRSL